MNTSQDSRKILEELQLKKQQLQKGLPIVRKLSKAMLKTTKFDNNFFNATNPSGVGLYLHFSVRPSRESRLN